MNSKINKITLALVVVMTLLAATACENYLEIPLPSSSVSTEGAFKSRQVIDKMMYDMYAKFTDFLIVPSWPSRAWECFADNSYNPTTSGTLLELQECNVQVESQSSNMLDWPGTYQVIMLANTMLEGLPEADAVGLDEDTREAYIAAAKTVRAYSYFSLVRIFGDVPLVTSTNVEKIKFIGRTPVSEIYAQIESDLLDAIEVLPQEVGEPYYINCRYIPQAILANVYLTQGKWTEAEAAATAVINSGNYVLDGDLENVFLQTSTETVMATGHCNDFSGEGARTAYNNAWICTPMGFLYELGQPSFPALSEDLVTSFEAGDKRKEKWVVLINTLGYENDNNRMFQNKYKTGWLVDVLPEPGMEEDNKFIRLAEIYLIRAEARARKTNPDLAGSASDLNKIRNRAGLANTSATTQTALTDAILHERRVELFFENGARWFDLVRTGKADAVLSVIPYKTDNWKSYMVLAPLPPEEMSKNPNLNPQNPGW